MNRNSRVHLMLKNVGVLHDSPDKRDDDSDINNKANTPDASLKLSCDLPDGEILPSSRISADKSTSTQILPPAFDIPKRSTEISVVTSLHKQIFEAGEISIEAPSFSPLTPLQSKISEINAAVSETSLAALASPLTLTQAIDAIQVNTDIMQLPLNSADENSLESPVSSPLPLMSPETTKLFNVLIEAENSDDSVADPNYEPENESQNNLNQNEQNNEEPILPSIDISEQENLLERIPRKRKIKDPSGWKVNVEKKKKLKGEPYKTKKGKLMQGKPLKEAKCSTQPKHKCITYIPEDERVKIYASFRNLESLQDQRYFVINHVTKKKKNRSTTQESSRRNFTLVYTLTCNNEKKVVCREFFLETLNITGAFVKGALNQINDEGVLRPDKRGKKPPPNKITEEAEKFIRDHIFSYPAVESHYCRRDSNILYLDSSLNVATMYKEYANICVSKLMKPVSLEKYRSIFRSYKLSFHKPKKDLCKHCIAYKEMSIEEKEKQQEKHELHLSRKEEARLCRDKDKEEAKDNKNILAFNFDLEAVLTTPKGATGPFFYVRKLAVYNLTVYNLGNKEVECYMWDETQGKRGTIEISTCIYTYIMGQSHIKQVRMMSDGAGGQQKNYHFSSMCLQILKDHETLEVIDHKFFETGHTHMECDSIHSKIELKSKHVPVYTPDDWAQIVRLARTNPKPYNVTTLLHEDFKDFGTQNQYCSKSSKEGRAIGISDAVWLQYRKKDSNIIYLKSSYNENDPFVALQMKKKRGKVIDYPIPAYSERIKISVKKKNDLMKLCSSLQIPKAYHNFYNNLPCSEFVRDCLPEPDINEDSE